MTTRGRRRASGFTLIELLVAMMVFLIAMTGIVALLLNSVRMGRHAQDLTIASTLASSTLEQARLSNVGALDTGVVTVDFDAWGTREGDEGFGGRYFQVRREIRGDVPREVEVQVRWPSSSPRNTLVEMTQLIDNS